MKNNNNLTLIIYTINACRIEGHTLVIDGEENTNVAYNVYLPFLLVFHFNIIYAFDLFSLDLIVVISKFLFQIHVYVKDKITDFRDVNVKRSHGVEFFKF